MSDLLFDSLVSCFNVINVCMYFRVLISLPMDSTLVHSNGFESAL